MRAARARAHGEGRVRARNVRQRGRERDRRRPRDAGSVGPGAGCRSGTSGEEGRAGARAVACASERVGQAGIADHHHALPGGSGGAGAAVRPHGPSQPRGSQFRLDARVRSEQARRHAQATLRIPVSKPRRRARVGAHARRAVRKPAHAHDRADPRSRGHAPMAPPARGVVSGNRRAGDRGRPDALDHERHRAAACCGARRDGGHAQPDLLRASAAAAARARAAGHRAHVRGAVARGRLTGDCPGRRAARARGPVCRLRDPVSGARTRTAASR